MFLLEIIQQLSERHWAIDFKSVPYRPNVLVESVGSGCFWLGEGIRIVGKVEIAVLVACDVLEAGNRRDGWLVGV
jgi:hypothetical protein